MLVQSPQQSGPQSGGERWALTTDQAAAAAPRPPEQWHLRGVPSTQGLQEWADILSISHLGFDIEAPPRTPSPFRGAFSRRRFVDWMLVDCTSSPLRGHRSKSLTE